MPHPTDSKQPIVVVGTGCCKERKREGPQMGGASHGNRRGRGLT